MKKILIRSGMTPLQELSVEEVLNQNLVGDNVGNLVYAYGIYRLLMTSDEVEFVPNRYKTPAAEADRVNESCQSFIIPMADMFREAMVPQMEEMTAFIRALKIPCVITGVGVRAPLKMDVEQGYPFDDTVRNFLDAVLEKSAVIGVRGEITGNYLRHLGYLEDRHYMVIGCPSMYCFGGTLKRRELNLRPDSVIGVNMSVMAPEKTTEFLCSLLEEWPRSVFLPQRRDELWTLYAGVPYRHRQNKPRYPTRIDDPVYRQDRVKVFLHAKEWMDFLSTADLSVGSRMHGNIAAILAGTPAVLIPHDQRMRELADYHKLPSVRPSMVRKCSSLGELIEKADFDSMYRCHRENFERYLSFLNRNGIDHIYRDGEPAGPAPLDEAVARMNLQGASVPSVIHLTREEMAVRWMEIYENRASYKNSERDAWKRKYEQLSREFARQIARERELAQKNESLLSRAKRKLKKLADREPTRKELDSDRN